MIMNKLRYLFGILITILLFTSCVKEDTLGISKETNYPILTMTGDKLVIMDKGATYTEPGVSAKEGEKTVEVKITGTVDNTKGGIYRINYSAINVDGFSASIDRYVIVIDKVAVASAPDYSGAYERTFYGSPRSGTYSDWTKVNDWTYTVNDPGGTDSAGFLYDITVYLVDANHVVVPIQKDLHESGDKIYCTSTGSGVYPDAIEISTSKYIWSVKGVMYGTSPRTFEK